MKQKTQDRMRKIKIHKKQGRKTIEIEEIICEHNLSVNLISDKMVDTKGITEIDGRNLKFIY